MPSFTQSLSLLDNADEQLEKQDVTIKTDIDCPECGEKLLIREGRYGKFYGRRRILSASTQSQY